MEKLIRIFIDELKAIFPQINVNYYIESDDQYVILHDNKELEYDNPDFYKVVGKLISKIFHSKDHYNMVFDYDYFGEIYLRDNKDWLSAFKNVNNCIDFKVSANEAKKTCFKEFKSYNDYPNSIESKLNLNAKSHESKDKKNNFINYKSSNEEMGNIQKFIYPYSKEGKLVA